MQNPVSQAPSLPVLKELKCPQCGSSLQQFAPSAQTLICKSCGYHIAVTADGLGILGQGAKLPPAPIPIALGQNATFQGTTFMVLGRVLFEGNDPEDSSDRWQWNEWLLGGTDGRLLWLEYDAEDGFVLSAKSRLREAFDVNTASVIPLGNGKKARVRERYPAQILGAEGELTWQAAVGDRLTVIDAAGDDKRYSVEADSREIELYEGNALSPAEVAAAFNHPEWLKAVQTHHERKGGLVLAGLLCLLFGVIGGVLGVVTLRSGSLLIAQEVKLDTEHTSVLVPVTITQANRPILVKALLSSGLPANTAAEIGVIVIAPDQGQTVVVEHEFYYETGVETGVEDSESYSEPYSETDYATDSTFVPSQNGNHQLQVEWVPGTGVTSMTVQLAVYEGHVPPTWFFVYGGLAAVVGVILVFVGSRHTMHVGVSAVKKG